MSRLNLKVIPTGKQTIIFAESEYGEASMEIDQPFIDEMIEDARRLRNSYEEALRGSDKDLEVLISDFGRLLFSGIIKGDILALFNRSVGGSKDGKLDIRLLLGEPRLNLIQWELMRLRNEYIGFRHNLVRHPFISRPARSVDRGHNKVRALVIAVDPLYGPGTVAEEHMHLLSLLDRLKDQVEVINLFQEKATTDNIIDAMFSGVDIFHFNGHAFFNHNNLIDSYLAVWGDHGDDIGRLSVRIINTLVTSQSVGFCFLNACGTARTVDHTTTTNTAAEHRSGDDFVSIAHSLIEAGVPMVLATNHDISVVAATKFSRRFYKSVLCYGRRIDDAVREGRAELFMGGERMFGSDWSCPILYARSTHFGLSLDPFSWEDSLDLYRVQNVRRPDGSLPAVELVEARIPQMDWRSASPEHQFRLGGQDLMPGQVAASWRTRRVKEGIGGFASVSAAFGRVGRIQMGNPGEGDR